MAKEYKRECPECGSDIRYGSPSAFYTGRKRNARCRKCTSKGTGFVDRYASSANSGAANAFFGKQHSEETKRLLASVDKSAYKTEAFRAKMRSIVIRGESHHMFGSSHKEKWAEKYGAAAVEKLELDRRAKISEKVAGVNNPMYGKPAPQGSGHGWKGWYNGWFFRSLRELAYVVGVIERNCWSWVSAETHDFAVEYTDYLGRQRSYFADFFVNDHLLVEVKPAKLHNSPNVLAKQKAAVAFCDKKGWEYRLVDPVRLTTAEVAALHEEGRIRFMDEYERLFKLRYKNPCDHEGAAVCRQKL